jgi:hypothetical protein
MSYNFEAWRSRPTILEPSLTLQNICNPVTLIRRPTSAAHTNDT